MEFLCSNVLQRRMASNGRHQVNSLHRSSFTDIVWSQQNTYDAQGRELTSANALGQVTTNTYNSYGQVLTTTDAAGVTTTNMYDANGNLLGTIDPLGNTTNNDYNSEGELIETDSPPAQAGGARQYTQYGYTGNDITSITTGYIDSSGVYHAQKVTTNTIDDNGNVTGTSFTWTNPTPGDGQPDTETIVSTTQYNGDGQVIYQSDPHDINATSFHG